MTARKTLPILALFMLMSAGMAIYASQYLVLEPESFPFLPQRETYAAKQALIGAHIVFGVSALLIGPVQFYITSAWRDRSLHKLLGRLYLLCVICSSAAAVLLVPVAFGKPVSSVGFLVLAILWSGSTIAAVRSARRGDLATHKKWMIRSYAMTFAAITLRAEYGLLIFGANLPLEAAYQIVSWSSWTLNLLFAEWFLVGRRTAIGEASVDR